VHCLHYKHIKAPVGQKREKSRLCKARNMGLCVPKIALKKQPDVAPNLFGAWFVVPGNQTRPATLPV
jgi:hypothetical protein